MAAAPRKGDNGGESGIEYDRSRSIFVGNLPFDVEDEEVYSLFEGKSPDLMVDAVRVVRDPQTSAGKGFAFVCFKTKVGARNALDNAEHTKLRNRPLRIIRFGFQANRSRGKDLPATTSKKSYGSKPRPGVEQRLSKKGVLSYEGARASKADGRPGKRKNSFQSPKEKFGKHSGTSKAGATGKKFPMAAAKKSPVTKRPAVAARKAVSQAKAGGNVGTGGGKRKREEKGMKRDSKGNKKKKFKK